MSARAHVILRTLLLGIAWASPCLAHAQHALEHALAPRWVAGDRVHAWPRQPLLSEARAQIGVPWVWTERGALGESATVCVIDTGIDLSHRDFLDEAGATRVRWLLDLDATPRGVHAPLEREGGAVWSNVDIDAARSVGAALPADWHGHGTVVASAAAGDDSDDATLGAEAGVAPRADLVIVRALRRDTLGVGDDDIARGAAFCAAVAAPSRTTMVIALGGHDGPHDGTSAIERVLTGFAHQGFAVVVAAGNDGQHALHASARLVASEPARFALRVPAPDRTDALLAVVVRGARSVRVQPPRGAFSRWVSRGERVEEGALLVTRDEDAHDGATRVVLQGDFRGGVLTIEARGAEGVASRAHAWLAQAELGSLFPTYFEGATAHEGDEVSVPATADGVIAVGASVSRGFVPGVDGPGLTADEDEDGRADYASRGPRVDGAPLPHVLAPGGWVSAALSADVEVENPSALFGGSASRYAAQRRGAHRVMALGTSISAGVLGGAIALARGLRPGSEADVRSMLATARSEEAWRPTSGAGLLDMRAWLLLREGTDGSDALRVGCTRTWITPNASDVHLVARAPSRSSQRLSLFAVGPLGEVAMGSLEMQQGFGSVQINTPAWATREVRIEAREGAEVRGECVLHVTLDGTPNVPRALGGCAAGAPRCESLWLYAGLVCLLIRARGRRSA